VDIFYYKLNFILISRKVRVATFLATIIDWQQDPGKEVWCKVGNYIIIKRLVVGKMYFLIPEWKFWFTWLQVLNVMNPLIFAGLAAFQFLLKKTFELKIYWFSRITAILGMLTYHSAIENVHFSNHQPFYYYVIAHFAPYFLAGVLLPIYNCCKKCRNPDFARDQNKI
jgi:hypothetical protein